MSSYLTSEESSPHPSAGKLDIGGFGVFWSNGPMSLHVFTYKPLTSDISQTLIYAEPSGSEVIPNRKSCPAPPKRRVPTSAEFQFQ